MPFHRFEEMESVQLTPHLSSAESPIIDGKYLYYCLNQKKAGTGSELHYHPNELLIFNVMGNINAVVGKDRRIVPPGTFILVPPNVRHSMKAAEDGPIAYLYIKDRTWTVVGIAADERLPDSAMSVEDAAEKMAAGEIVDRKGGGVKFSDEGHEDIIIEGVPDCYYPMINGLDAPYRKGKQITWIEGERSAFGFFELPNGYEDKCNSADHEYIYYVLDGAVKARVGNEEKDVAPAGIIEIPKGTAYELIVDAGTPTRLAAVRSSTFLEGKITD